MQRKCELGRHCELYASVLIRVLRMLVCCLFDARLLLFFFLFLSIYQVGEVSPLYGPLPSVFLRHCPRLVGAVRRCYPSLLPPLWRPSAAPCWLSLLLSLFADFLQCNKLSHHVTHDLRGLVRFASHHGATLRPSPVLPSASKLFLYCY